MTTEGRVKCTSPQNTFGVSGVNSVAAKSNIIEGDNDQFFKCKKNNRKNPIKCLHAAPVVSSKCP